ncbi:MAG: hypothetical protein QM758_28580 [Armatimonas sp.]
MRVVTGMEIFGIFLVGLFLIWGIFYLVQKSSERRERELEEQLEKIRKAGQGEAAAGAVEIMTARASADAEKWRKHSLHRW